MFANMVEGGAQAVHRGDGFVDTYSQLYTSVYGQVNWVGVNTPLPSEFVKAWDEKTINIVGFEFDAIRGPSITEPCVNNVTAISTCKETRVPAWEQVRAAAAAAAAAAAQPRSLPPPAPADTARSPPRSTTTTSATPCPARAPRW